MPITTATGIAYLALDAFIAGIGWTAGCWLIGRILGGFTRKA